jgi:ubiquinone/menaquinone biosynthesis C-methylase UbiE
MADSTSPAGTSLVAGDHLSYGTIAVAGGDTATPLNLQKRLRLIGAHVTVPHARILDCGCGAGEYVRALAHGGADAWGIEFSREKVATAPREVARRVSIGDLHDIAMRDATVDAVLLNEVLEHVPDDGRALREVYRVLKPGGTVLVFSPNRRYPFETHGAFLRGSARRIPHYTPFVPYVPLALSRRVVDFWARNYWPHELRRLVRRAGFRIVHTDFVWQTFEGISQRQPKLITQLSPVLRRASGLLERLPGIRSLGVSQFIVARKPLAEGRSAW